MRTTILRTLYDQYILGLATPGELLQHWIALCDIIDAQETIIKEADEHFEEMARRVREIR